MSNYQDKLVELFATAQKKEAAVDEAVAEKKKLLAEYDARIATLESQAATVWADIDNLMKQHGVVEETLPGAVVDYKLYYQPGKESVDVEDIDAVPEQYVRFKREPNKAAIAALLKLIKVGRGPVAAVNWATLRQGETKLVWKAVKKK